MRLAIHSAGIMLLPSARSVAILGARIAGLSSSGEVGAIAAGLDGACSRTSFLTLSGISMLGSCAMSNARFRFPGVMLANPPGARIGFVHIFGHVFSRSLQLPLGGVAIGIFDAECLGFAFDVAATG